MDANGWIWDTDFHTYRIFSPHERVWVLQDGTRLPSTYKEIGSNKSSQGSLEPAARRYEEVGSSQSSSQDQSSGLRTADDGSSAMSAQLRRMNLTAQGRIDPLDALRSSPDYLPDLLAGIGSVHNQEASPADKAATEAASIKHSDLSSSPAAHWQSASQIVPPPNLNPGLEAYSFTPDPRYTTRPSSFFVEGKVFRTLWSEPNSVVNPNQTVVSTQYGEIYTRVRCFVVLRTGSSYCSCLPIQTYSGRGVSKPGVVKAQHAIIYTGSTPPRPTSGEKPQYGESGMRKPIRVRGRSRAEMLDPMSRINFMKIYNVKHNVRAYDFGDVHDESMRLFVRHFRACWAMDEPLNGGVDGEDDHSNETVMDNSKAFPDESDEEDEDSD